MTASVLITPPAVEPVSLAEAKAHARIEETADDALVSALITAARQWAEKYTGRVFILQTWRLWLDEWPNNVSVELPRGPLISVSSIQTFDDADTGTIWASANYYVDAARTHGRVVTRRATAWPSAARSANAAMIEYVAGYGATAASVPEPIRLAIKQLVAHWYENRGESAHASAITPPPAVALALLDSWRARRI